MSDVRVPDLNIVLIAGRVVREPDTRSTSSGRVFSRFTLANNRRFKGKDGNFKEEAVFVSVVMWDRQAEYASQQLRKGRPVLVEGRLQLNEWEDRATNQRRSRLEIVARRISFLDKTTTELEPFDAEGMPPDEEVEPYPESYPNQGKGPSPLTPKDNNSRNNWDQSPEDDVPF